MFATFSSWKVFCKNRAAFKYLWTTKGLSSRRKQCMFASSSLSFSWSYSAEQVKKTSQKEHCNLFFQVISYVNALFESSYSSAFHILIDSVFVFHVTLPGIFVTQQSCAVDVANLLISFQPFFCFEKRIPFHVQIRSFKLILENINDRFLCVTMTTSIVMVSRPQYLSFLL